MGKVGAGESQAVKEAVGMLRTLCGARADEGASTIVPDPESRIDATDAVRKGNDRAVSAMAPGPRVPQLDVHGPPYPALFSPFLITAAALGVSWKLSETDYLHKMPPTTQLAQLTSAARVVGTEDAARTAVWEYSGRIAWNTVEGAYLTCLAAAMITGLWVAWRVAAPGHRCGVAARWWPPLLLTLIFLAMSYGAAVNSPSLVSRALLDPTVSKQGGEPEVIWQQQFFSATDQILALFLAALAVLVLPGRTCADERCLRDRSGFLHLLLTIGAGLLVLDILREDALFRYAAAFIDPANAATVAAVRGYGYAIEASRGALGTALLAAIYLPAALVLHRHVWSIVPVSIATIPDATKWLEDRGLSSSVSPVQLRPALTVLLPLLAGLFSGPVGEVVKSLGHQ